MSWGFIPAIIEEYVVQHATPEPHTLKQVNQETVKKHAEPHMLSGHVQGRILSFLCTMLRPKYVLEIGTMTGYSALCLSEGLQPDGELHTIELRSADAEVALNNFKLSSRDKNIILHEGNAKEIIPTLPYTWDLVFIDADKVSYIDYYELVLPRLSRQGFIIADNVLYHGEVVENPVKGKNAKAIHAFNNHVANDNRVEQVILTVRDGLLLIKKK
jgi:predicted O-methyltransferase YrrM